MHNIDAEMNHQKCHTWTSHGHISMLPMAIPDAEILAFQRFHQKQKGWQLCCIYMSSLQCTKFVNIYMTLNINSHKTPATKLQCSHS